MKSQMEHKYTSTGIKFWRHPDQMSSYQLGKSRTVISTHISPEGHCNLNCSYCSVKKRNKNLRIELDVIKDYVTKLMGYGLKAVILTGGGEPLIYPAISPLVRWLKDQGLSVALITNGTVSFMMEASAWQCLSWVRVSLNLEARSLIGIPLDYLNPNCIVGCSIIYTGTETMDTFEQYKEIADYLRAKYVRLLPDCLDTQDILTRQHTELERIYKQLGDSRFFHQQKNHRTPRSRKCHQAHFRPYLSEERFHGKGQPGSVYPCDSVVLNDRAERFEEKFQICRAKNILDFLDRNISLKFNPKLDCTGCVFADNVDMLDDWKNCKVDRFSEFQKPLMHEEFV